MVYPLVSGQHTDSFEQASLLGIGDQATTSSLLPNATQASLESSQQLIESLSAGVENLSPAVPPHPLSRDRRLRRRIGANVGKWINEALPPPEELVGLPKIEVKPSPLLVFPACRVGSTKSKLM